jgi:hypothetical protein
MRREWTAKRIAFFTKYSDTSLRQIDYRATASEDESPFGKETVLPLRRGVSQHSSNVRIASARMPVGQP